MTPPSRTRVPLAAALLVLVASGTPNRVLGPDNRSPGHTAPLVITAAHLVDVERGQLVEDVAIVVEGARIVAVGRRTAVRVPENARRLDLGDVTVLPGLIDAHVHLSLAGAARINAEATLRAGFTTVQDLGAIGYANTRIRDSVEAGRWVGPRVVSAGQWLGVKGGTCDFNGIGVSGVEAMVQRVREDVEHGADLIKVCLTAWVSDGYQHPEKSELTDAELAAVVAEATRLGKPVVAHAIGQAGVSAAVRAGLAAVVHSGFIDPETARELRRRRMYMVSTLVCLERQGDSVAFGAMLEKMRAARAQGVAIVFGTDAGVIAHGTNALEFPALLRLGMTPAEAIRSATSRAAESIGWASRIGTLAAGKQADIIAVPGNPLADLTVLQRVGFVMKGGEVVRDELSKVGR